MYCCLIQQLTSGPSVVHRLPREVERFAASHAFTCCPRDCIDSSVVIGQVAIDVRRFGYRLHSILLYRVVLFVRQSPQADTHTSDRNVSFIPRHAQHLARNILKNLMCPRLSSCELSRRCRTLRAIHDTCPCLPERHGAAAAGTATNTYGDPTMNTLALGITSNTPPRRDLATARADLCR